MLEKASKRLFVALPSELLESDLPVHWTLDAANSTHLVHYLTQVVRIKPNDALLLVDLHQPLGVEALVSFVAKRHLILELRRIVQPPSGHTIRTTLAVALIKEHRWDWMLQKATELGVTEIVPLLTERVSLPGNLDWDKKQVRWQQVIQAASEQSERWTMPKIHPVMKLSDWLTGFQTAPEPGCHRLFGFERDEPIHTDSEAQTMTRLPLKNYLKPNLAHDSLVSSTEWLTVIGPEGGWSNSELTALVSHHFQPVGLGSGILRAETAAIQMMGILNYELGL
jgi:16S rRNA (uracil1498-N3)-methyltransferase